MINEMTADKNNFSLLKQVPIVTRARAFRLYTKDSHRLIDLWLNGGAAVLGHTPPNLLRELKNTASRGLYAPLPHFTEGRLIKALSKLLPARVFRLFAAPPQELSAQFEKGNAALWHPFTDPNSPFAIKSDAPLLIPVIPGIQLWRGGLPFGLCAVASESEEQLAQLPEGDALPPVLLAAAARGIHDILAAPERAKPVFKRVFKALQTNKTWKREGIYLYLKEKSGLETWSSLFKKFLEAGFLLPPVPSHPLVLPAELSDGEEAKLAACLSNFTS